MSRLLVLLLLLFNYVYCNGQKSFEFPDGVDQIEIPFITAYNLIVVPTNINGVELNMILDTGASKSIVFNFSGVDSLTVKKGKLLKLNGYGQQDFFQAYFSENNSVNINGFFSNKFDLFIAAEKEINLEGTMGFPVHGLLGADFFSNALVQLDFNKRSIFLYKNSKVISKKLNRRTKVPIKFVDSKPYVAATISNKNQKIKADLLIDVGSSDALLLLNDPTSISVNRKSFEDYLGFGMNGEIFGRRTKIDMLELANFKMTDITVSIPLKVEKQEQISKSQLTGSIGGEVLSRFDIIFDYQRNLIFLDKNDQFKYGFFYNMAGINLIAGEKELFTKILKSRSKDSQVAYGNLEGQKGVNSTTRFTYVQLPKIYVNYVRPDSPADKAGILKGDEIIGVNYLNKGNMTLYEVASKFYKNPNSKIRIRIKRGEEVLKFKIKLKPII